MRLPILFILFTVLLDAMGIGLIMPVMPELIQEVRGEGLGEAALWGGVLATTFAFMQFLFGPTLGNLSDRYGRRIVLLVSLFFLAIDYLIMALAGTIMLLLIGRIIGGITSATQPIAAAFMADISKPEDKAANFGLIGAAFGVGFVLGPMLGGLLADWSTRAPFYAAAVLAALNFVFGYFVLPETVTDAIRRPFRWARANPLGAFRHLGMNPELAPLFVVIFIYGLALFVYPAVWAFFGTLRFGWSPGMIGLSLGIFGVCVAVVQGLLMRPLIRWLGEWRTVIVGFGFDAVGLVLLALVPHGWMALALTPIAALGSMAGPAIQGIMSRIASDDQQGELQGALASVNSVATIFAPLVMTQVFWFFTSDGTPFFLPGAPFLLAAALTLVAIAIVVMTQRKRALTV